jgi:hypothetical protein
MAQQTAIPALPEDTWVDGREPVIFIAELSTGKTMLVERARHRRPPGAVNDRRRARRRNSKGPTASSDAMSAATPRDELVVLDELDYLARRDRTTSRSSMSSLSATDARA